MSVYARRRTTAAAFFLFSAYLLLPCSVSKADDMSEAYRDFELSMNHEGERLRNLVAGVEDDSTRTKLLAELEVAEDSTAACLKESLASAKRRFGGDNRPDFSRCAMGLRRVHKSIEGQIAP